MSEVRVRFAPSPTGFLHVGGARTAIFNWLYARRHGGRFVLRIEDTDRARSSEEMVRAIVDGMAWLGLAADEGPFFQSEGVERHAAAAGRLLATGAAYRDFMSAEELKALRVAAEADGRPFVLPDTYRELSSEQSDRRAAAGEPFAVRFRAPRDPDERVVWDDRVHGETGFPVTQVEDFVILRSDGSPTYMLSVVCDDIEMRITHVIRGDDHISNTPKQILLYRALDAPQPTFAHLPLILGTDKKRLSKRHGAVSVLAYRDEGFLPEAMLNFLSLLGWNPGDDRECLTREELVEAFSLERVGRSGAIFDVEKLTALNRLHFARLPLDELVRRVRPAFESAGLWSDAFEGERREWFARLIEVLRDRARRLDDFVDYARPFLDTTDRFDYEEKPARKHLKGEELVERLEAWIAALEPVDDWRPEALEAVLRELAERLEVGSGKLIHPTRLALTGRGVGPGLFEVMELVGRERSLARLRSLVAWVRERDAQA